VRLLGAAAREVGRNGRSVEPTRDRASRTYLGLRSAFSPTMGVAVNAYVDPEVEWVDWEERADRDGPLVKDGASTVNSPMKCSPGSSGEVFRNSLGSMASISRRMRASWLSSLARRSESLKR